MGKKTRLETALDNSLSEQIKSGMAISFLSFFVLIAVIAISCSEPLKSAGKPGEFDEELKS